MITLRTARILLGTTLAVSAIGSGLLVQNSTPDTVKLSSGRPTILDFYADWCPICVHMKTVLADSSVRSSTRRFNFRVIDSTQHSQSSKATAQRYHVYGLPTYIFIGSDGREKARLVGEVSRQEFKQTADGVR